MLIGRTSDAASCCAWQEPAVRLGAAVPAGQGNGAPAGNCHSDRQGIRKKSTTSGKLGVAGKWAAMMPMASTRERGDQNSRSGQEARQALDDGKGQIVDEIKTRRLGCKGCSRDAFSESAEALLLHSPAYDTYTVYTAVYFHHHNRTMASATATTAFAVGSRDGDPYIYQTGFGNRFASEAVPGTLPVGQNAPQKCAFDLYSEQLNGSGFISPRAVLQNVWMYRIRPSVAHGQLVATPEVNPHIASSFLPGSAKTSMVPDQLAWDPFPVPEAARETLDFLQGIRTVAGQGDPTLKEGMAVHVYTANVSMGRRAMCNNDGDLLVLPQHGRLQIQTELGWLMVRPGELVVLPAGLRFRVLLPDGPSRGYIQEIFAAHYELPELGPIGSNGMALPGDFESPIASFDVDEGALWHVVYKMAGALWTAAQDHTPFDVVAWRGNLVPYKYATEKFICVANVNVDQADPTVYCVLTARSKVPGQSLADFLVFTPKWIPTANTFRPPYYHRNMSAEIMGLLYGTYGGSAHVLEPGGLSYEAAYMQHGETYETWQKATSRDLVPERVCEDTVAFMFHIGVPLRLTDWAVQGPGAAGVHVAGEQDRNAFKGHFLDHLHAVNQALSKAGAPPLAVALPAKMNGIKTNGVHKPETNGISGVH